MLPCGAWNHFVERTRPDPGFRPGNGSTSSRPWIPPARLPLSGSAPGSASDGSRHNSVRHSSSDDPGSIRPPSRDSNVVAWAGCVCIGLPPCSPPSTALPSRIPGVIVNARPGSVRCADAVDVGRRSWSVPTTAVAATARRDRRYAAIGNRHGGAHAGRNRIRNRGHAATAATPQPRPRRNRNCNRNRGHDANGQPPTPRGRGGSAASNR